MNIDKIIQELDILLNTKQLIADALVQKGQTVVDSDSFRSYANKIASLIVGAKVFDSVEQMNADTSPIQDNIAIVLDNNEFLGIYKYNGTSYEQISNQFTLDNANQLVNGITAYGKTGIITGTFLGKDSADATASNSDILIGKTAYINNEKITGTLDATDLTECETIATSLADKIVLDFNQLTYLGVADGKTAYIATNIVPSVNDIIEIQYSVDNLNANYVFGSYDDAGRCGLYVRYVNTNSVDCQNMNVQVNKIQNEYSNLVNTPITITMANSSVTWQNKDTETTQTRETTELLPIVLFGVNSKMGVVSGGTGLLKIMRFKIKDISGELKYDLIPVSRKSDSQLGMYDLVNCKYYFNAGADTFVGGETVE